MKKMSNSSLTNVNVPAHSSNYSVGRSGRKIEMIAIHHMAGVLSAEQCGRIFQTAGRGGSSHYGIGNDGKIGLYVDESNTAWTNSNWDANCKSVTIETSNSSTSSDWPVGDKALNSLIKLVADISKRNGLGKLVKSKNVVWHSMYTSTICPGPYLLSKLDYIIEEANKINFPPEPVSLRIENITNKKVKLNKDANLWDLNFKTYAEAKSVKKFKKGDIIEVSAKAYHPIGAIYYLTEYSYSNKINNGFNIVDCDDYVETIAYKVKWGDTLNKIAKKYNTTVEKIAKENNISNPNKIKTGTILKITKGA